MQKMKEEEGLNRIILIGNGFDCAHKLKTKYEHFISAFWREELKKTNKYTYLKPLVAEGGKSVYIFEDDFIKVKLENIVVNINDLDNDEKSYGKVAGSTKEEIEKKEIEIDKTVANFKRKIEEYKNSFLELIEKAININNWVDIEELYYKQLVRCAKQELDAPNDVELSSPIKKLNKDFEAIRYELKNYLLSIDSPVKNDKIAEHLKEKTEENKDPDNVLFLNFNYTKTENLYANKKDTIIHIHGTLGDPKKMIFGYGDELSKNFTEIENLNNNSFFENTKSVKYAETNNYGELEEFLQKGNYEIFIFGHSCGNSDRTLLNLLFEKGITIKDINGKEKTNKCKRIKIFYYQREDGTDDFSEKTQNIFRDFEVKANYRALVKDKDNNHKPLIPLENPPDPILDNIIEIKFDEKAKSYTEISDEVTSKKELKSDFKISKFQVTQKLFYEIMEKNPSYFNDKNNAMCPVEHVTWYDCVLFCNKLSEKYKFKKYYNINGEDVTFNVGADGFRLPTEAEWEYAARGGVKGNTEYAGCNSKEELKYYAWYNVNSENKPHSVGQWKSNNLGLYDMSGNVWEWCEDSYEKNSRDRVLRGGSWGSNAELCRVSYRYYGEPGNRSDSIGFRLARSL